MRHAKEIEESLKESARLVDESRSAGVVANYYLTTTIILATVLFFEGITLRLASSKLRLGTFFFGAVLFLISVVRLATLPWMIQGREAGGIAPWSTWRGRRGSNPQPPA